MDRKTWAFIRLDCGHADYNAATSPATAIAAPAKEPKFNFEAAPAKGAGVLVGAGLVATGAFGAVPFAPEVAPPVGAATRTVAMVMLEDPTPVALRSHCKQFVNDAEC